MSIQTSFAWCSNCGYIGPDFKTREYLPYVDEGRKMSGGKNYGCPECGLATGGQVIQEHFESLESEVQGLRERLKSRTGLADSFGRDLIKQTEKLRSAEAEAKTLSGKYETRVYLLQKTEIRLKDAESRLAQAQESLDLQEMVKQFHLKFNFTANPAKEKPTLIPIELARKRLFFLRKEVDELEEAMEKGDLIEIADAIGDILYFSYGDAVAYGIPVAEVFREIHRSNMTKSPCPDKDGKAIKGIGYSPPDIEAALGVVGEATRK